VDRLVAAHIAAKARLQTIASRIAVAAWDRLPGYDRENVDEFLSTALPPLHGANLQSVALTEAYLARKLGRLPLGVSADSIVAGIRNGAAPATVYERAFIQVWSDLGKQTSWEQAVQAGRSRVESAAATDVQLSFRDTLIDIGQQDERVVGWQRVADSGACDFCQEVDGARLASEDPMPLHNNCGCGVDPITEPFTPTPRPDTVAIHDHGELGPVLAAPGEHFTTEHQIAA
jgi:hypothetical protein